MHVQLYSCWDLIENRGVVYDFVQNYKCDLLSCLKCKPLDEMAWNHSEDGIATLEQTFCELNCNGHGISTKLPYMCTQNHELKKIVIPMQDIWLRNSNGAVILLEHSVVCIQWCLQLQLGQHMKISVENKSCS